MNENLPKSNFQDRREERHERRMERRALRGNGGWVWGIMLILLAGILLLQNLKIYSLNNWWALFILIPALGSFATAWRVAQTTGGRFNVRARGALIVGLVLVLVTAMFLFGMNWTILGPVLLALAGIGLIVNVLLPD
jgi:ABC-type uncharacterized transport system permease subunit